MNILNTFDTFAIDAAAKLAEVLEWFDADYDCLHHTAFNEDYYIIGTYEAKKALEEVGTFEALGLIKEYELENFGNVDTDLTDPEQVANMLFYIVGEHLIDSLNFTAYGRADEKTNAELIAELRECYDI